MRWCQVPLGTRAELPKENLEEIVTTSSLVIHRRCGGSGFTMPLPDQDEAPWHSFFMLVPLWSCAKWPACTSWPACPIPTT